MMRLRNLIIRVLCPFVIFSISVNMYFYSSTHVQSTSVQGSTYKSHATKDITKILVVAYMRSGSSFTADALRHGPHASFYSFEPLWNMYFHSKFAYDVLEKGCRDNNCVLHGRGDFYKTVISTIKDIFECKFSSLSDEVLYSFSFFREFLGDLASLRLKDCFPNPNTLKNITNNDTLTSRKKRKSECISFLESTCQNTTVRIIKTIRMPLHLWKDLLETIPNMKILHLLRDPRGMLYSRRTLDIKFTDSMVKNSCHWMSRDVDQGEVIASQFPGRFYSLKYECLARSPHTVLRKLYNDLSLIYNSQTENWVQEYMCSSNQPKKDYLVVKSNSTSRAIDWRMRIRYQESRNIDKSCREVYTKIGTRVFNSATELKNLQISETYATSYTARYCK